MKVVCIKHFKSQGFQYRLTYGKVYEVIKVNDHFSYIELIDDLGNHDIYYKSIFVSLDDWRLSRFGSIGI